TIFFKSYQMFFSSRRRHTTSKRDWSSDVCSSDLPLVEQAVVPQLGGLADDDAVAVVDDQPAADDGAGVDLNAGPEPGPLGQEAEIGRASCRARAEIVSDAETCNS